MLGPVVGGGNSNFTVILAVTNSACIDLPNAMTSRHRAVNVLPSVAIVDMLYFTTQTKSIISSSQTILDTLCMTVPLNFAFRISPWPPGHQILYRIHSISKGERIQ